VPLEIKGKEDRRQRIRAFERKIRRNLPGS
jgi:hypothetical protein